MKPYNTCSSTSALSEKSMSELANLKKQHYSVIIGISLAYLGLCLFFSLVKDNFGENFPYILLIYCTTVPILISPLDQVNKEIRRRKGKGGC
ncbi:MAG: hypothetical protein AAFU64_13065 [Bacteroidota bacterium]